MKIIKTYFSILGEGLGLLIGLAVLIYLLPRLPFVTESYSVWLPIAVWTTVASSVIKVFKHILDKPRSYGFEALSIIPGAYSTYKLIEIFPLDFSLVGYEMLNQVFRFALYVTLVALGIAFVVNFAKLLTFTEEKKK